MPLRYKRLIILFSLGIMLIGLGTFSLLSPGFHFSFPSDKNHTLSEAATFGAIKAVEGRSKEEVQSQIEELVQRYFTAKQQVDMDTLAQCVSDSRYIEEKKLLAEAEYVQAYENIQCLILDGPKTGTYRVYVYYDVKVYDIDTLVPSLNALYVTLNDDDAFQVYMGTLDSDEQRAIEELDQSAEVQKLVATVQKRLEDVVSSDQKVREFREMLESVEDSDDVQETAAPGQ